MKRILLSVATIILAGTAFAQTQPDYYRELGLSAGIAPFTHPGLTNYVGDKNKLPYTVSGNFHYNFTENIQAGIDMAMTQWQGKGDQNYNGLYGQPSQPRNTDYIYADRAWSLTARFNYMFPTYDQWHINRSNFYVGAAAGAVFTVNDGNISYSQFNNQSGEENRYVSKFNYQAGTGFVVGIQVGYSYYLGNHFGINVEAAPRYSHIYMKDGQYNRAHTEFDVWSYPVSVGLKFRF